MGLPTSGKISIGDILIEMGLSEDTQISLENLAKRWLLHTSKPKFNERPIQLSFWHGEFWKLSDYLRITPVSSEVSALGGEVKINVYSNTSWEATFLLRPSYVSINLQDTQGIGNGIIRLNFAVNRNSTARRGVMQVRTMNGNRSLTYEWVQLPLGLTDSDSDPDPVPDPDPGPGDPFIAIE